jgi:hypothetical protein
MVCVRLSVPSVMAPPTATPSGEHLQYSRSGHVTTTRFAQTRGDSSALIAPCFELAVERGAITLGTLSRTHSTHNPEHEDLKNQIGLITEFGSKSLSYTAVRFLNFSAPSMRMMTSM